MKINNLILDGNNIVHCPENLEKMSMIEIMLEFHTYKKLLKPNFTGVMAALVTIFCILPLWIVTFPFQPVILSIFDKIKLIKKEK